MEKKIARLMCKRKICTTMCIARSTIFSIIWFCISSFLYLEYQIQYSVIFYNMYFLASYITFIYFDIWYSTVVNIKLDWIRRFNPFESIHRHLFWNLILLQSDRQKDFWWYTYHGPPSIHFQYANRLQKYSL